MVRLVVTSVSNDACCVLDEDRIDGVMRFLVLIMDVLAVEDGSSRGGSVVSVGRWMEWMDTTIRLGVDSLRVLSVGVAKRT